MCPINTVTAEAKDNNLDQNTWNVLNTIANNKQLQLSAPV